MSADRQPRNGVVAGAATVAASIAALLALLAFAADVRRDAVHLVAAVRDSGRGAEAMLQEVTLPAEAALAAWPAVHELRTATRDGETRLSLEITGCGLRCADDTWSLALRRRLIDAGVAGDHLVIRRLAGTPVALDIAVLGGEEPERSRFALDVLRPALLAARGVERVEVIGASRWRALVTPLAAELAARGATPGDLAAALCDIGLERAAGRVLDGGIPRPVSLRERIASLDALLRWPLPLGAAVSPLGDVAEARLAATDDGTLFRAGGEPGVLLRLHGSAARARAALAALRAPAGLRILPRAHGDERELAFEAASDEAFRTAFQEPDGASAPNDAELWTTWVAAPERAAPDASVPFGVPALARGALLVPRTVRATEVTATLRARGLRLQPADAADLWLSAAREDDLARLVAQAATAARASGVQAVALPEEGARTRLALRADLDEATRQTIAADVAAALGRRDCGRVEIPGVWPSAELAPTRVPRLALLPVHAGPHQATVPLAAALVDEPSVDLDPVLLRRNGWPATILRFASAESAEKVRRQLERSGARAEVVAASTTELAADAEGSRRHRPSLALAAVAVLGGIVAAMLHRRGSEPGR